MNVTVWIISLVISIVCAYVCYRIADSKSRNTTLWAVLGFLFPIIALIIIAVLKPSEPKGPAASSSDF